MKSNILTCLWAERLDGYCRGLQVLLQSVQFFVPYISLVYRSFGDLVGCRYLLDGSLCSPFDSMVVRRKVEGTSCIVCPFAVRLAARCSTNVSAALSSCGVSSATTWQSFLSRSSCRLISCCFTKSSRRCSSCSKGRFSCSL